MDVDSIKDPQSPRLVFLFGSGVFCSPGCVGDEIAGHDDAEPGALNPDENVCHVQIPDAFADVVLTCARCAEEIGWVNDP